MFDFHCPEVFEWERDINKEFCIQYSPATMASECCMLDDLVEKYFASCRLIDFTDSVKGKKRDSAIGRIKVNLRSLLSNLYAANRAERDCYLSISFKSDSYTKDAHENPFGITRDIRKIVERMADLNCIDLHIGFNDRKTGKSRYTRIRSSLNLIRDLDTLPENLSEIYVEPKPVRLKDEKNAFDTRHQYVLDEAEKVIKAYNKFTHCHEITVRGKRDFLVIEDKKGHLRALNVKKKAIQGIFHVEDDGSLSYGRMHRGVWQSVPSDFRKHIEIDGQKTVELDYKSQVLNIVASLECIQLEGDPYGIDLSNFYVDKSLGRKIVKQSIVIILNAKNRQTAIRAIKERLLEDELIEVGSFFTKYKFMNSIIDKIFDTHPFLKEYAFAGKGKKLFMHDAEIAREIIQTFLEAKEVILPIHDGFITAARNKELLEKTMTSVWRKKFGTDILISQE